MKKCIIAGMLSIILLLVGIVVGIKLSEAGWTIRTWNISSTMEEEEVIQYLTNKTGKRVSIWNKEETYTRFAVGTYWVKIPHDVANLYSKKEVKAAVERYNTKNFDVGEGVIYILGK